MPPRDEPVDKRIVVGRLAGQRHHNAHSALGRQRAEQHLRVLVEQRPAVPTAGRFVLRQRGPAAPGEPMEDADHLVQVGQHMRFGAAQRGHTDPREPLLQAAHVEAPHGQVVGQVDCAGDVRRIGLAQPGRKPGLMFEHGLAQCPQLVDQRPAGLHIPAFVGLARRSRI